MTSRISPFHLIVRAFGRLPVTCLLILVCCFLFALSVAASFSAGTTNGLAVKPGALDLLVRTDFPDVYGMIALWKGEWWRLTVSAFHHGDLLHLLGNVLAFWIFADLLEERIGRFRYLIFCLLAGTFSMLPEIAMGKSVIGISGIICAQLGLILIMRRHDEELAEQMHPLLVPLSLAMVFISVPLTMLFNLPIANGAHMLGLLYGAAVGWLCYDLRSSQRLAADAGLAGLHLGLAACVLLLVQPVWNGRYLAWRAITQTQSLDDWRQAVKLEPSLESGWRYLARHYLQTGEPHQAWVTALKAAKLNRSSMALNELARHVWRQFDSAIDRAVALDEVRQMFGDEHEAWIKRFELPLPGGTRSAELVELPFPDVLAVPSVKLDGLLDVPTDVAGITQPLPSRFPAGAVDPESPASARLGITL